LSLSSFLQVGIGLGFDGARALFVESFEVLSDVSLQVSNLRLHLLLLLLEVPGNDSIGFLHSNQEVSPGFVEGLNLPDVVFSKAFDLSRVAFAFPSFDVLELLLDRSKTVLPGLLLRAHIRVTLLVSLKHVEGSAVFLQFFDSVVEELKVVVKFLLGLFNQVLLDFSHQFASTVLLVVSQASVV